MSDDDWQDDPLLRSAAFEGMATNAARTWVERLELAQEAISILRHEVERLQHNIKVLEKIHDTPPKS